jgi:hypothetical protein
MVNAFEYDGLNSRHAKLASIKSQQSTQAHMNFCFFLSLRKCHSGRTIDMYLSMFISSNVDPDIPGKIYSAEKYATLYEHFGVFRISATACSKNNE